MSKIDASKKESLIDTMIREKAEYLFKDKNYVEHHRNPDKKNKEHS